MEVVRKCYEFFQVICNYLMGVGDYFENLVQIQIFIILILEVWFGGGILVFYFVFIYLCYF